MKKSILFSLMVIGAVAAMITAATSAVFTDSVSSGVNQFTTGTLDISSPSTATWSVSVGAGGLAPGDEVYQQVDVSNAGTLGLKYTAAQVVAGDSGLAAQLDYGIAVIGAAQTCNSTNYGAGTLVFTPGHFSATSLITARNLKGSAEDNGGPASERLCFKIALPLATDGAAYMNKSASSTVTFSAEQTRNNP